MGTESPSALGRFLEFHGSGGWGKTKRASERAGPSSDCGERRKTDGHVLRALYREFLALDHPS
jgi:hypothetical protein